MRWHADPDIEQDRIASWAGHPDDHHDDDQDDNQ
jgi:hypothetical protein